jgi:hypothetical protein
LVIVLFQKFLIDFRFEALGLFVVLARVAVNRLALRVDFLVEGRITPKLTLLRVRNRGLLWLCL